MSKDYLRYTVRKLDYKSNYLYNAIYVAKGVARATFGRFISKQEKDVSDLTVINKVLKGTNENISNMLNDNIGKIILYREFFRNEKWEIEILETFEVIK